MTKGVLDRMADYTQYLTPIPSSGFRCNGCCTPLDKGSLFCDCADCGAIYCAECVENGTFEAHTCEDE